MVSTLFSTLTLTSSGRTPGSSTAIFRWSFSSMTSHAGSHAEATLPPFQLPSASSMIRLRRLRPLNRSWAGSMARRLVVTSMVPFLLWCWLSTRPLPSGLAARGKCSRRAGRRTAISANLAIRPIQFDRAAVGLTGVRSGRSGAEGLPAELPPEHRVAREEVPAHGEEGKWGAHGDVHQLGDPDAEQHEHADVQQGVGDDRPRLRRRDGRVRDTEEDDLAKHARRAQRTALHEIGEEEPAGDCGGAEGAGNYAFTQQIVMVAGHGGLPAVRTIM